jgi:hypothetical protein
MLLITKGSFWEPTMFMKANEILNLTHDVYENKRFEENTGVWVSSLLQCLARLRLADRPRRRLGSPPSCLQNKIRNPTFRTKPRGY